MFWILGSFPSSSEVTWVVQGPNGEGAFLSSSEDGNRSTFRNVVLFRYVYLEFRTMDKVQKPSESE
jgi:hypothetical protein